jgi:enoyl-CoA hydratase/carnithine racemase
MDELVRYATDDRISMVTLNRPSKLNAINAELRGEITRKDGLGAALKWRAAQFAE